MLVLSRQLHSQVVLFEFFEANDALVDVLSLVVGVSDQFRVRVGFDPS